MTDQDPRVQDFLQEAWAKMQDWNTQAEAKRVAADPVANKTTTVFAGEWNYRYYTEEGSKRGGRKVRWCWTTKRNIAGYFLMFREVETPFAKPRADGAFASIERDSFFAHKTKQRLIERAYKKAFGKDYPTKR